MPDSFPRFFNPEELGQSLKEVATDIIKAAGHDIVSRWFHSSQDADLYIWMDLERNILKQQLSYYGQVVEWNVVEGVRTGHLVVEENDAGDRAAGLEFLNFDSKPQIASVEQAVRLLDCITALKDEERKELRENFRRLKSSQIMPPAEMIRRFGVILGGDLGRPGAAGGIPLWTRIFKKISDWFKI